MKVIVAFVMFLGLACAGTLRTQKFVTFEKEANMNYQDVIDLITSILNELDHKEDINKLKDCILNIPHLITELKTWIEEIKTIDWKDFDKVIRLFANLFTILHDTILELIPCSEVPTEMNKLVEKLGKLDLDQMLQRIMKNAFEIFDFVTKIITNAKAGDFSGMGTYIGKLVFVILLDYDTEYQIEEAINFLKGFFKGLGLDSFEKFKECAGNIDPIIAKFNEVIELLSDFNIENIVSAVIKIKEGANMIMEAVAKCTESFEELKKILAKIENFDLEAIAEKIKENLIAYVMKIWNIVSNFQNKQYEAAGLGLGKILKELMSEELRSIDNIAKFMEGFVEGLNQGHNFDNVTECVHQFPIIIQDFEKVIEKLKNINWKNLDKLVEALMEIFDAFKNILKAIKPCSKTPAEIDVIIEKIMAIINDPSKFLQKIQENLISIISDIISLINHLKDGDWKGFGKDFGDMIYRLVLKA